MAQRAPGHERPEGPGGAAGGPRRAEGPLRGPGPACELASAPDGHAPAARLGGAPPGAARGAYEGGLRCEPGRLGAVLLVLRPERLLPGSEPQAAAGHELRGGRGCDASAAGPAAPAANARSGANRRAAVLSPLLAFPSALLARLRGARQPAGGAPGRAASSAQRPPAARGPPAGEGGRRPGRVRRCRLCRQAPEGRGARFLRTRP
mmetsp:Transcript_14394/g.42857  ORF Transcript_14394/g.42857 Transcript_14394/m.42857 type:complete len:206 (+) Transcript_14394:509-1126(+)